MNHGIQDIAASVHARLLNKARDEHRPFNEVLQYYAMERFLYRISHSRFRGSFVLKGALLLRAHEISFTRPTRDIDLLGYVSNSVSKLEDNFRTCCNTAVLDDGLRFDERSVKGEEIVEEAEYHGVRIKLKGCLGRAKVTLQIDLGFGDVIEPETVWIEYPELLDYGKPFLQAYSLESAIAEKFQTMLKLDIANSRMKDFYDIWLLANNQTFVSERLIKAIVATFEKRVTQIPHDVPSALTNRFAADDEKKKQWSAFCKKIKVEEIPLTEIVSTIKDFLMLPIEAYNSGNIFSKLWKNGMWRDNEQSRN